ncbi:MAG: flavodoxin family protein [Pseudomonadales bacterium]
MINLAVVYHSDQGHTLQQAKAIAAGASEVSGVTAELFAVEQVVDQPSVLNDMDAIVFGSPTYLGNVSATFKAFMDATSPIWFAQQWEGKLAAGFTHSQSLGGDKLSTLISMSIFAAQHGMIWVGQAQMNTSPPGAPGHPDAFNRTGTMLGAVAQTEAERTGQTLASGDLKTAWLLGERVAKYTRRVTAKAD